MTRALLALLLFAGLLCAAPLPAKRPAPRPPEPTVYYCWWSGTEYDIRLYPCGRYECRYLQRGPLGPVNYEGEWEQDGMTLVVRERPAGTKGFWPCRWSVGPHGAYVNDKPSDVYLQRVVER